MGILTYHVVSGEAPSSSLSDGQQIKTVNGAKVTVHISTDGSVSVTTNDGMITANVVTADVKALNGVIHVIDKVLIPGQMETATTPTPDTPTTAVSLPNIVETAQSIDDFSTLVTAVVAAGLVDTLSSTGPFTVFAPVNSAFAKIGKETITELLANPDQLSSILTYHVVSGEALSSSLSDGQQIETVNGAKVTVHIAADGGVSLVTNDGMISANVVTADVKALNGVIHVIDTVLIPGICTDGEPSPSPCEDTDWTRNPSRGRDCGWVAHKPESRCALTDESNKVTAYDGCPKTCG